MERYLEWTVRISHMYGMVHYCTLELRLSKAKDDMSDKRSITEANDAQPSDSSAPFERWLDKKLKSAYGSVLEEPIPQDLIKLLRQKLDHKDD